MPPLPETARHEKTNIRLSNSNLLSQDKSKIWLAGPSAGKWARWLNLSPLGVQSPSACILGAMKSSCLGGWGET